MFNSMTRGMALAVAGLGLAVPGAAQAAWELNMPKGVTSISAEVYDLHMLILYVCCLIAVVVFGAMIYSIMHHRKSRGIEAARFSHSTRVEIIWTVIPIVILIGMAVPAAGTLIRMEDARNSDLTIKITGYQWKWRYDYIDHDFGFYSNLAEASNVARQVGSGIDPATVENYLLDVDRPLVVPVGAKVRVLLTAADVIHSWWVPALGGKKDAIPGFINEYWFQAEETGTFRGQCAELCGRDHAFMPIVVRVVSGDEYRGWLDEQTAGAASAVLAPASHEAVDPAAVAETPDMAGARIAAASDSPAPEGWTMEQAVAQGEKLYNTYCAACHQVSGQGMPPTFPAIAGSAVATGEIKTHISVAMNGRPGTAMAAFGPQLSDDELAAIITYQRNAFGNQTGDLVTPEDIAAAR